MKHSLHLPCGLHAHAAKKLPAACDVEALAMLKHISTRWLSL